jgi:hypothetical protein
VYQRVYTVHANFALTSCTRKISFFKAGRLVAGLLLPSPSFDPRQVPVPCVVGAVDVRQLYFRVLRVSHVNKIASVLHTHISLSIDAMEWLSTTFLSLPSHIDQYTCTSGLVIISDVPGNFFGGV